MAKFNETQKMILVARMIDAKHKYDADFITLFSDDETFDIRPMAPVNSAEVLADCVAQMDSTEMEYLSEAIAELSED